MRSLTVLWFQIAISNVPVMQMAQGLKNTSCVETRVGVWNTIAGLSVDDREELSTLHELNEHIQVTVILECANQVDNEGMVD